MADLILIDLSSIAHPIFHVTANEPDPNACSTAVIAKVRALASGKPHVAVCVDAARSWRKDLDKEYKANRPESDAVLHHQINVAVEALAKQDGFPCWFAAGYEADDLIGAAVYRALRYDAPTDRSPFDKVLICTADKDLCQLVSDKVTIQSTRDGAILDEPAVYAKFGVKPNQIIDFLSLVGDKSDNITGAKGIGPKIASKLLTEFGTLERLLAERHKVESRGKGITPAIAGSLTEFEPRAATVRQLVALRLDAPIPFDDVLKERQAADVAEFLDDARDDGGAVDDIDFAMQTLPPEETGAQLATSFARELAGNVSAPPPAGLPALPPKDTPKVEPPAPVTRPVAAPAAGAVTPPADSAGAGRAPAVLRPITIDPKPQALAVVETPDVLPPARAEWEMQLEPRTVREARLLAADLFQSRLFSAYGHPAAILSTILAGRELGLQALASLRAFHIIDGRPTLSADLIRSLVIKSGTAKYFRCTERSATRATWETQRGDDPPISLTFTIDEAKLAWGKSPQGWDASGWGKNPADMLVARASSKLARLVYADVVMGLYAPEEME